ncbi:50S ribosomal protein L11 methyltransferase [Flavicella sp.]|uniref:50S ribosomal protein L11 methyltransferase n=1 Tax=Flavicella sp. TaxID=2957742 RepID=UPI002625E24E|nr:50S ribosomal protein L11 methyltransferase [Flavicella sp.]MDG1805747.1 50S ribosomal protein L11 methyltransferase [Flavicella sp.]
MNTIYNGFTFVVEPRDPATEILIAELGYAGFESFVENETGVIAYIQKDDCSDDILENIFVLNSNEFSIEYKKEEIEQVNWNSEWEKNFSPIQVEDKVSIRAPFHENPNLEYDIIIEPKMSFGTGHHETTHMMVQHLLDIDVKGKKTLDMGCGTGILAIFAEMKGAMPIDAIDIDNWCYLNTIENVERNNCAKITSYEGDASLLEGKKYDLIIANINRNILLNDLEVYATCLTNGGTLLLSGFYAEDIPLLDEKARTEGLSLQNEKKRNKWVSLRYLKNA